MLDSSENVLWTKRFILLCAINFFLFMSFFFLLSTLPVYLVEELEAKESQVGLIISIFTVAAIISRPFAGYWMDRGNQRKFYLFAVLLFFLATSMYYFVHSLVFLLLLRFFHGISFGLSTTAGGAMAAEWIPEKRKGEGLGYFGNFSLIAMSVGPLLGVLTIEKGNFALLFMLCSLLAGIAFVISLMLQPPQKKVQPSVQKELTSKEKRSVKKLFHSIYEWKAIPYSLSMMMIAIVFGGVVSFISLYAIELGDAKLAGAYFSLYALSLVVVRPFAGWWYDRKGPSFVIALGCFFYFIGMIFLGMADGALLFYIAAIVIGLGYGSLQPSFQAMVIQQAPQHRRGAATATFFSMFDIGVGVGAILLGWIASKVGYSQMFMVSSVFLVFSYAIFFFVWKRKKRAEKKNQVWSDSKEVRL